MSAEQVICIQNITAVNEFAVFRVEASPIFEAPLECLFPALFEDTHACDILQPWCSLVSLHW